MKSLFDSRDRRRRISCSAREKGSLLHTVRMELAHACGTADASMQTSDSEARIRYEIRLPPLAAARRAPAGQA